MFRDYNLRVHPYVNFLSEEVIQEVHNAALRILQRTGVVVHRDHILEMLRSAGCKVTDGNVVHMPAHLVEDAIRIAPASVNIYNRKGDPALQLEDKKSYWGTGSDTPFVFDSFAQKRRRSCLDDVTKVSIIVDYLENIDFLMCMGVAHELSQTIADKFHFVEMVTNTVKPIAFTTSSISNLNDIYQMACEISGGEEAFQQKPFIMLYTEPMAPLIHPGTSLDKLQFCIEHDIPVIYNCGTTAAQNGPATIAGSLALGNARILSGIVIGQMLKPGAKMIVAMHGSSMEPSNAIHTYASPEHAILQAASKSLCQHYGLPTFGRAGTTESKIPDQQAAFEAGYEILMQALCGDNLIHDVGYLESGLTSSLDSLVMCNEFIGAAKRVSRGFDISNDTLALDLIDQVGPTGHYMAEPHTVENYRKEFWMPKLLDRNSFADWQKLGEETLLDRARKKVKEILHNYKPEPLEPEMIARFTKLAQKEPVK